MAQENSKIETNIHLSATKCHNNKTPHPTITKQPKGTHPTTNTLHPKVNPQPHHRNPRSPTQITPTISLTNQKKDKDRFQVSFEKINITAKPLKSLKITQSKNTSIRNSIPNINTHLKCTSLSSKHPTNQERNTTITNLNLSAKPIRHRK
jgi:hypothetical protein